MASGRPGVGASVKMARGVRPWQARASWRAWRRAWRGTWLWAWGMVRGFSRSRGGSEGEVANWGRG